MSETGPIYAGRREFVIGGLMAATSGIAYSRKPKPYVVPVKQETFDAIVPRVFGDWQFTEQGNIVLPPPDALQDRLYDNLLTRLYVNSRGQAIMLVLAFKNTQDGIVQVHRPEVCYPAAGFALDGGHSEKLNLHGKTVPAKAFTARRGDRIEQILYYTRLGSGFPLTWLDQRVAVLEANMNGFIPDGLLARMSIIQEDQNSALILMRSAYESLAKAGGPAFHAILTGSPQTS